jgi:plasmid stabilization system protein ParE
LNEAVWSARALANLRAIRAYIEQFNPKAAGELAAQLIATGNSLVHFPNRGRSVPKTNMRVLRKALFESQSVMREMFSASV